MQNLSQDEFFARVYALSPASQRFLASIGVWDLMDARRLTSVQAMEIHGDGNGLLNLNAWQSAQSELAWIVESSEIERVLVQAAQVMGLRWVTEKFASYAPGALTTDRGTTLEAELFIAADGAQSPLRAAAGLTAESRPYGATALVAHFNCKVPHQGTALQWFGSDGVLALLPMPDTAQGPQVSMVWSLKEAIANEVLAMPAAQQASALHIRLAAATAGRLGALTLRSAVHGFPLTLNQSPIIGDCLALAGDAAHRLHPLAGQGLNLGLGDVQALVDTVAARESFRSPGDPMVLRRYRRLRAEPVMAMRLVTDGLARLFDIQHAPVVWLRNMGMNLAEKLPFIKRQLIAGASR
jgi:ubiquinone biosynthesis UbiH/UbiF/VisC/COQ6 family hydroxylase